MPYPYQLAPQDAALGEVLALIKSAFAFMDGRVDPPSTATTLTAEDLRRYATEGEIWAVGHPVIACMILTPKPPALYLGKLAVAAERRHEGLARLLIDLAEDRARDLGLAWVELGTRVELSENQTAFTAMGFAEAMRECHPGFDRPTSIVYRRPVPTEKGDRP